MMNPTSTYLAAVDDAVCQYQYETLEARGVMVFIRELERHGAGLGELFTDDNEPTVRALFGLAKSFEDTAATMCKRIRDAQAVFRDAPTPSNGGD